MSGRWVAPNLGSADRGGPDAGAKNLSLGASALGDSGASRLAARGWVPPGSRVGFGVSTAWAPEAPRAVLVPSDFSDVDASDDPGSLVRYLDWMAHLLSQEKARLLALLDLSPGDQVLDVGCGAGHDLRSLADAGATPVGVDTSAHMLAESRQRGRGVERMSLVRGDGEALPFALVEL